MRRFFRFFCWLPLFCFLFFTTFANNYWITNKQLTICIKPFRMKTLMQRCLLTVFFLLMTSFGHRYRGWCFQRWICRWWWGLRESSQLTHALMIRHLLLLIISSFLSVGWGVADARAQRSEGIDRPLQLDRRYAERGEWLQGDRTERQQHLSSPRWISDIDRASVGGTWWLLLVRLAQPFETIIGLQPQFQWLCRGMERQPFHGFFNKSSQT